MTFEPLEMPPIEIRGKHYTYQKEDSVFAANARLLQSIWRLEHFGDEVIVADEIGKLWGNLIPTDKGDDYPTNFLSDNILNFVQKRIDSGKKIEEMDLMNNLLLTQVLIYNLFVELALDTGLATLLFRKLFPEKISKVLDISFDYLSPQKPLNDHNKLAVALSYISPSGNKGFLGIDMKYAEALTEEIVPELYELPISTFGKIRFKPESIDCLQKTPLVHIWQKHLICMEHINENSAEGIAEGFYLFIYPEKNEECYLAVEEYQRTFKEPESAGNLFSSITLEKVIEVLKEIDQSTWITDFENRYLRFEKIDMIIGCDKNWEGTMLGYEIERLFEHSLNALNKALTKNPNYLEAYFWKAQTLQMLNRFEEEVLCYEQAILLKDKQDNPNRFFPDIYFDKIAALFKLGRLSEAWEVIQPLLNKIETYKEYDDRFVFTGNQFLENGKFKEAFVIARKLLLLEENNETKEFFTKTRILAEAQGFDLNLI